MKKDVTALKLNRFLPYRLTKLSGIISRSLAERYSRQFDLTIQEWRVIAIIGEKPGLTAREVGDLASLDKVNISRAIERLEKAGRINREVLPHDRRAFALYLTETGKIILSQIVPLAQNYENLLLEGFSADEIEQLDSFLNRLDSRADELIPHLKENN
ncbi:MAG: MarR family transcriptional regulator [Sneathiella sp.]|nr:MarR family transcriptional regulator [Sneathiella sp.]